VKSSVTQLVELAPALAAVLGADSVHTEDAQLDAYTADTYWSAISARANGTPLGRPDVVVMPRSEDEVAAALRMAASQNVPVVAWGGGSGTQGGAVPVHGGLVIDLRALDHIVEIDERSLTVTAQAGVNGRALERALNQRGLMLPHYPASSEWATVGGYVAARSSGVLSTRLSGAQELLPQPGRDAGAVSRDEEASLGALVAERLTLRASTLNAVLYDILRSLIHHGWNKLILVNGHGSKSDGAPDVQFEGYQYFSFPMDRGEFSRTGVIGNPMTATPAKGEEALERFSDHLARAIDEFRGLSVDVRRREFEERV
jgi:hypothetical protein